MINILICDDDRDIVAAIAVYLRNEGYAAIPAYDGREALLALDSNEIHLIIMDVMMPRLDGFRATMEIRRERNIPIIMLSAKSEYSDKVLGLNAGADDYVTKPFNPLELIARVKSQLRRYTSLGSIPGGAGGDAFGGRGGTNAFGGRGADAYGDGKRDGVYGTGGLVLDDIGKTVSVDGADVRLTPLEYKILFLLIRNPGRVFSIDEIYERVWGAESLGSGTTVSVHIRRIREKIEINPGEPKYIKVVWGVGYKIERLDGAPSR
jgi:DNA-binding response OmpR family regulator